MIKTHIATNDKQWDTNLDALTFAYNTATHSTTNFTPYKLMVEIQEYH
jgi:hypothetical protein